jgi:murein DD-endopeptidase MepM/ murein hydrolase activator NlpD
MALPTALPAMPGGISLDPSGQQEYTDAIQKVLASLEQRNQPNYFELAGSLLDPGKTGGIGEAIGRTSTALGAQQQRRTEQEPGIAMMRAQLAGQKYQMSNQSKALNLVAQTFGMEPSKLTEDIKAGTLEPSLINKLTPGVYTSVRMAYPELASALKDAFGMDIQREELLNKQNAEQNKAAEIIATSGSDVIPLLSPSSIKGMKLPQPVSAPPAAAPPAAAPTTESSGIDFPVKDAKISSGFGMRPDPINKTTQKFHAGIDFVGTIDSPVEARIPGKVIQASDKGDGYGTRVVVQHADGSKSYYAHLNAATVKEGDPVTNGTVIGLLGSTGKSTGAHLEFGIIGKDGKPIDPTPMFNRRQLATDNAPTLLASNDKYSGLSIKGRGEQRGKDIEKEREIEKTRVIETEKPFIEMQSAIYAAPPKFNDDSISDLTDLRSILKRDATKKDPDRRVFGIFKNEPSLLNGLAAAAKEGVGLTTNIFTAQLKIPTDVYSRYKNFAKEDWNDFERAYQILGTQFLMNAKANKGLLGANPSNNDAILLRAPMPTVENTIKNVDYFARNQILDARLRNEHYTALRNWEKTNKGKDPGSFFDNSSYTDALGRHRTQRDELATTFGYR